MLRRVRDEYIAHLPNGPEMLAAYREFAPVYVEQISKRPDAETVWKLLYAEYILEAVKHAEAGHFRKAYLVYLLMLESVQQSFFGGV
jgi:ribonucleotide reductase beta subunit family protein with ferritin-like domain